MQCSPPTSKNTLSQPLRKYWTPYAEKLMDGKVARGNVGHQELAAWVEGLGL